MAPVAERVRAPVGEREAVTARGEDHRRRKVAGAPPGKRGKEVRSVSVKALRVGRAKALAVGIAATSVAVLGAAGGTGPHEAAVSLEEGSSPDGAVVGAVTPPDGEEVPHEAGGATSGGAGYGEPDGHMAVVCCEERSRGRWEVS
jgi:hypothetical protein